MLAYPTTPTPSPAPIPSQALVSALCADAPICVIVGHYGVGKTNLAINLALACAPDAPEAVTGAAAGEKVTLADLDLVNPYFRSSDYPQVLAQAGVRLTAPTFAGTALDTPSLGGQLFSEIEAALAPAAHPAPAPQAPSEPHASPAPARRLIVDVGGDDAGATALGRFADALAPAVASGRARMLYVVNAFRNLTQDPGEAAAVLREIEGASRLRACGVVNNSHLCELTSAQDVAEGRAWARRVCDELGLPLVATCVPAQVFETCVSDEPGSEPLVRVGRYVLTPWQG